MIRLIKFKGLKELKEDDGALATCLICLTIIKTTLAGGIFYCCPLVEKIGEGVGSILHAFAVAGAGKGG